MTTDRKIRIAIDGPGGAGKSSVAKEIAKRRGLRYVDTGALYRSVGLYVADHGIGENDEEGIVSCLPHIRIELVNDGGTQRIIMNGEDVGDRIRTPQASVYSSAVSKIPAVRDALFSIQRDLAGQGGVVMDGRDIGTVIIPDAEVKIFLTASPEERARRRYKELREKGVGQSYEDVLRDIIARDENDSTRETAPLRPADDAITFVNDGYDLEETVRYVMGIIDGVITRRENR